MTNEQPAPKKSIWKSKWLWIGIAAIIVIGGIANLVSPSDDTPTADGAKNSTAASAEDTIAVPDVAGMSGSEAEAAIKDAGLARPTLDAGDDVALDGDNWTATGTTPAAGEKVAATERVTITVERSQEWLAEEAAKEEKLAAAKAAAEPDAPIAGVDAQTFCEDWATAEFDYGVEFNRITQMYANEATDDGWYIKVGADITNDFGATAKDQTIECHMSGTNADPVMDDFLYY